METANNTTAQYWCFVCEKDFLPANTQADDVFCPTCQNIAALIDPEDDPRGPQSTNPQTQNSAQNNTENQQSQADGNPLRDLLGSLGNMFPGSISEEEQLRMLQSLLGSNAGHVGAPAAAKDVIHRLKQSLFRAERSKGKDCAICQEDYKENDRMVTMPCDHLFHKECAITWLNLHNTCPSCRKPLNHITEKPSYDYFS